MKKLFLLLIYLVALVSEAQTNPKTIYCNEVQNVALILPDQIQQAVTGSENFVFSYNKTSIDSLGLLQGREGHESNLIIRTKDGGLYSYLLKYRDTLLQYTYFIKEEERINPITKDKPIKKEFKVKLRSTIRNSISKPKYFDKLSNYYLNKSKDQRIDIERKDKMQLEVKSTNYYKGEVYIVYAIKNKSGIDFKINGLELYKVQSKKSRRSSFQKWGISPIYKYHFLSMVLKGQEQNFVVVYPKFTLGEDEKLEIVLTEKEGSRYLRLDLKLK